MARTKLLLLSLALLLATAPAVPAQEAPAPETVKSSRETLASRKSRSTLAPTSQAWWLGTAVMILALGGAGAICMAAKHRTESGPTVRLQVVGRVALPPKHAVFAVKAGGRTLLIGVGPQGAPSLVGELDADDEPVVEPAKVSTPHRPVHTQPRFDVRIGDES
ncbi:flagellar biosynthetic protein FliO [Paludisphaera rhizosphaerae]|uniref:flagellar biosynthetic protein FliO n=1 Tax=Paludisphaera rhizosphaerae TaxID=2711216 RepID=UPI0013ED7335|nr:flagellar biosynthetic protein FliO [Paludisphaera rhizosphaerae]